MKRKLFKLLVIGTICSVIVFTLYKIVNKDKINYVVLGDYLKEEYNRYVIEVLNKNLSTYNNYSDKEETIDSLLSKIKNSSDIKKDLRESNLVTITLSIGNNLEDLLKEIRKYAQYEVILISNYSQILKDITNKYNITYINSNTNSKEIANNVITYVKQNIKK